MKKLSAAIILSMVAIFCGNNEQGVAESNSETPAVAAAEPKATPAADIKSDPVFEHGHHGENSEKMKKRLEQLFVWRVSDRLQLNPQDEAKFTDQFKRLSDERTKLFQDLDAVLDKIEHEKDNPEKASKLLTEYNGILKKQGQIQTKEMDTMSKLFGTKKMVQYVLLKREMTQRFKRVLSTAPAEKADVKAPDASEKK